MNEQAQLPPSGRRCSRPRMVECCPLCAEALGINYTYCTSCRSAINCIWQADWLVLLADEQIEPSSADETLLAQVVVAELLQHSWTVVDVAMTLVHCTAWGSELGGGPVDCGECTMAFRNVWADDVAASQQGHMTGNEHALRVGRWVLRYPHRHSQHAVAAWQLSMPRLLTGWLPTTQQAHHLMALVKNGQLDQAQHEMYAIDRTINRI